MSSPRLVKLGPRTLEKALSVVPHSLTLHGENVVSHSAKPGEMSHNRAVVPGGHLHGAAL